MQVIVLTTLVSCVSLFGYTHADGSSYRQTFGKNTAPYNFGSMANALPKGQFVKSGKSLGTNTFGLPYDQKTIKSGNKPYGKHYLPVYIPPPKYIESDECIGQFVCSSGDEYGKAECLVGSLVCDGYGDCSNGADEVGCRLTVGQCLDQGKILCSDGKGCGRPCDGRRDCSSGEDENPCPATCQCGPGAYRCGDSRTCLNPDKVCDGVAHCPSGEDERDCPAECMFKEGRYLCSRSDLCIDRSSVCDGEVDCPNGDDELHCPDGCKCNPGEYLCVGGRKCISQDQLCEEGTSADDPEDCPLGDDEDCPTADGDTGDSDSGT